MSRTLTATAVREMLSQSTGNVFLQLLTFSGPGISTVRLVNNTQDIVSGGFTFTGFPFSLRLPIDAAERLADIVATISNVDQSLIGWIRGQTVPVQATLNIIDSSEPNSILVGPFTFDMTNARYDAENITVTLSYEPILQEPYPAGVFDPQRFPGIYGRTE